MNSLKKIQKYSEITTFFLVFMGGDKKREVKKK